LTGEARTGGFRRKTRRAGEGYRISAGAAHSERSASVATRSVRRERMRAGSMGEGFQI
jgi:hypothetical protein